MPDEDFDYSNWMQAPTYTYQGQPSDPNSPLYGGPGWIDPSRGEGGGSTPPMRTMSQEEPNYSYPTPGVGGMPSSGGSPSSTYSTNPRFSEPNYSVPPAQGTPPTPARSGSFQGPNLPPAQFQRLNQLLTNPNAIAEDPAYKFLTEQGQAALARTQAAKKQALAGGSGIEALKFGQGNAMQYLNQLIQQLLGASNASRIGQSGTVGPSEGTQGEYAAQALIPIVQKLFSGGGSTMPSMPMLPPPSYGGYQPRLQGAMSGDPRLSGDDMYRAMLENEPEMMEA